MASSARPACATGASWCALVSIKVRQGSQSFDDVRQGGVLVVEPAVQLERCAVVVAVVVVPHVVFLSVSLPVLGARQIICSRLSIGGPVPSRRPAFVTQVHVGGQQAGHLPAPAVSLGDQPADSVFRTLQTVAPRSLSALVSCRCATG